jgi:hypothetical protein
VRSLSKTGYLKTLWIQPCLKGLGLFILAFIPRICYPAATVSFDEAKWILRSGYFFSALQSGNFTAAASQEASPQVEVLAPAVTTLWSGVAGLTAKYVAGGITIPLPQFLASLPYDHPERIPLDFFPWVRFPTMLITALFIACFYFILRRLLNDQIALIAGILLALDPFFLHHSRVIHHDALVTVFSALSLLALLNYLQAAGGKKWLVVSGCALGLALVTKPTAAILLPFAGLLWLHECSRRRSVFLPKWLIIWGIIGLAAFFAVWPALWSDPLSTLSRLLQTSQAAGEGDSDNTLIPALVSGGLPNLGFLYYPLSALLRWGILPTIGLILLPFAWRRLDDERLKPVLLWLIVFALLFMLLLTPLGTRDDRYYMPAWPALMALAAVGLTQLKKWLPPLAIGVVSLLLLIPYAPYYVTYYNPLIAGPLLAPKLVKVGGGVGMEHVGAYLNSIPGIEQKTVAAYDLESLQPFFKGKIVRQKTDRYTDYSVNYIRQIQNHYPNIEYLAYFAARTPQHIVRLNGIDYAYIYLEPSPRYVKNISFGGLQLVGQTLDAPSAQPGQSRRLTLLWRNAAPSPEAIVSLQVRDSSGNIRSESAGPLIAPEGPSAVEGHYQILCPPDMPAGDYPIWASVNSSPYQHIGELAVRTADSPEASLAPESTAIPGIHHTAKGREVSFAD